MVVMKMLPMPTTAPWFDTFPEEEVGVGVGSVGVCTNE